MSGQDGSKNRAGGVSGSEPGGFRRWSSDRGFLAVLILVGSFYVIMLLAMLAADLTWTSPGHLLSALASDEIQYSIKLSLISCSISAFISLWVAIPIGYLLSRYKFPGRNLIDAIVDIPIVLPPLVVGLSLLILFQFVPRSLHDMVVYEIPAVILAQFMVAAAFAVRTMRATFDQICLLYTSPSPRDLSTSRMPSSA